MNILTVDNTESYVMFVETCTSTQRVAVSNSSTGEVYYGRGRVDTVRIVCEPAEPWPALKVAKGAKPFTPPEPPPYSEPVSERLIVAIPNYRPAQLASTYG